MNQSSTQIRRLLISGVAALLLSGFASLKDHAGGRASGTNDKAGSWLNLIRWVSPRTIKETLVPSTEYRYPFMEAE